MIDELHEDDHEPEPNGVVPGPPPDDDPDTEYKEDRPMKYGLEPGRAKAIDGLQPNAGSLIGSWFHVAGDEGTFTMQGCVVAEPQPGWYLLQLYDWKDGQMLYQRLAHFGEMTVDEDSEVRWRFFDSAADMNRAFEASIGETAVDE